MHPNERSSATSSSKKKKLAPRKEALKTLPNIPNIALENILDFLDAKGDRHNIRLACQDLCDFFDGCNTRMWLKIPDSSISEDPTRLRDQLLALLRRSQQLKDSVLPNENEDSAFQ